LLQFYHFNLILKSKKGNFQGILKNCLDPGRVPEPKIGFAAPWSRSRNIFGSATLPKSMILQSFHTLMYTCTVEFDFLGWEMPGKICLTLFL
jgi:hypothetical protein